MNNGSERMDEEKIRGLDSLVGAVDEMPADLLVHGPNSLKELAGDLLRPSEEPQSPSGHKDPFQYYEPAEGTGGLPAVICTCGWSKHHLRFKVLMRASEKHFFKTGHNTKQKRTP